MLSNKLLICENAWKYIHEKNGFMDDECVICLEIMITKSNSKCTRFCSNNSFNFSVNMVFS